MTIPKGFEPIEDTSFIPEGFEAIEEQNVGPSGFGETLEGVFEQFGRKGTASALATPRTLADLLKYGSRFLAQKGIEQQLQQGQEIDPEAVKLTETILKGLGMPSELLEKINYPSQERWEEMIANLYNRVVPEESQASIEPRTAAERVAATTGEFAGNALLGGFGGLLKRLGFGTIGGLSAGIAKEAGAGTAGQLGAAFGVPAFISLGSQIASGKFKPSTEQLKQLYKFGKEQGFTEEELTSLLQSRGKLKALGKVATPTKKTEEILGIPGDVQRTGSVGRKFDQMYDQLKSEGRYLYANPKTEERLVGTLYNIADELKASKLPSDEKIQVINKIEDAAGAFSTGGASFEELIASYIDVNQTVNWKKVAGGKKELAKIKKPFKDAAKDIDSNLGERFEKITDLYSKFKDVQKTINPNDMQKFARYGKYFGYLTTLATEMATGNVKKIPATAAGFLGVELSQRLATKLLTDPKYQNLMIRTANAIKSGSRATALKTFESWQDQLLEDFPEEARKVDWKELKKDEILQRGKNN